MKIAICFVGFLAFLTSAHALNCSSGYEIQSEIFTDTYWKSEICPESGDPQMCLRSEGEIIIFGAYNGKFNESYLIIDAYLIILF